MKNVQRLKKSLTPMLYVVLCLVIMFSAVACKKQNQTAQDDGSTEDVAQTSGEQGQNDVSEQELYKPADKDYNRDLTIYSQGNYYYYSDTDGYTGEIVDDAVYRRALYMQDTYGVNVVVNSQGNMTDLSTALDTGAYICDFTMLKATDSVKLAQQGFFHDLNSLNNLNLSASYWDQRIQSEYAIGDKLYFMEGDYTILDEMRTYVVLYNDTLYSNYGYYNEYGTPYAMVDSGTWTLEKMLEMSAEMYKDNNNNQVRDESDSYGIVGELTLVYYAFLGSGMKTVSNNNGQLTLVIKDDTAYNLIYDVLEDTMAIAQNESVLMPQLLNGVSDIWTAASDVFENGRALFRTTSLSATTRLGQMSSRFGILPIPAYTETQGGYYCWVSGNNHQPMMIPKTVTDVDTTSEIIETFCYHSRYLAGSSLYDSYFEEFRYNKLCRTEDDIKMLDLVFRSKTFDFDQTTGVTGIESAMFGIARDGLFTTLSSTISSLRETAQENLNNFILEMS